MKPLAFKGTVDHMKAEVWFIQMEKVLKVLNSTKEQKVLFVTYMLEGEASHWWRMAERILHAQGVDPINWEDFLKVFDAKYFSYFSLSSGGKIS